ncbi:MULTISPECIES: D-alanine--D-alanine ligase [unclassified Colwellia]|uniref:D-alanine--D-alanine ligase n=1 Tax=unclassified Colwellia TaxID=196834 RepID=UPI0015F66B2B|nr:MULTISPECIES: D-alanine--D-alanine ligase [unclassified Colwellia]MBA6233257.1 D-alanine--D-alanine ligase [Colwellia sp. MB02u-7]MBA6236347.1 D-alanine--D-alanine ligase [Colwellia sp. MB02u-11]MBA6256881.1 D-alanine--D-alanine ligase [Colwellia sp. MB3u-28]MBA6261113.1 D-alanine--D-alanine ligase [Colwellia sp. MB3u-41]MBA6298253.1 D-alanine--D-alanine ligase [Colwellia sp. MB3u-22]
MKALKDQRLAVLYGGDSAERDVSLNSGQAIAGGLRQAGFDVELIDTKGFCLTDLTTRNIDRVFIALHGRGGEDGCVQGALQYMGIPYTGSDVLGSALSMDKIRSKQIFQAHGLPTAAFAIVEKNDYQETQAHNILDALGGMVMVKPANEGSSIGMAKAQTANELHQALTAAFEYDEQILVEAWINGPEYTVAILGEEALPAIHMETPREFYDYEAKYQSTTTQYHCPAGLSEEDEHSLQALALKAFKATGAKGWGRVDVMRNNKNQWQLLEVNTVPGMTETSLVPKSAKVHGLSFSELVTKIVEISTGPLVNK